jgi:hypothetical protein
MLEMSILKKLNNKKIVNESIESSLEYYSNISQNENFKIN